MIQYGQTPLHHASERGRVDVVSLLLKQGADIEAKGWVCADDYIDSEMMWLMMLCLCMTFVNDIGWMDTITLCE